MGAMGSLGPLAPVGGGVRARHADEALADHRIVLGPDAVLAVAAAEVLQTGDADLSGWRTKSRAQK
jgi:hypothetical protein